jgi:hypothetical protein
MCRRLGVEEVSTYKAQVRIKPVNLPGSLEVDLATRVSNAAYHRATSTLNLEPDRVAAAELPGWVERALVAATGGNPASLLASPA